jgi:aspartate/methionine/tyrosine aminotransferase
MEMGVPGLPPSQIGTDAEIAALKKGVASQYPMIDGHPPLKKEASRFAKLFLDIDVSPEGCIPTVGSMMGAMAAFMVINRSDHKKRRHFISGSGIPGAETTMPCSGA